jgi:hypothetical protein
MKNQIRRPINRPPEFIPTILLHCFLKQISKKGHITPAQEKQSLVKRPLHHSLSTSTVKNKRVHILILSTLSGIHYIMCLTMLQIQHKAPKELLSFLK